MSKDLFFEMRVNEIEVVDHETVIPMQGQSILISDQK
jgi:hypothetical protein